MKNSSWLLVHFPIKLTKGSSKADSAVVMAATGKVSYHGPGGDRQSLEAGALVSPEGRIELGKGASVKLFYAGAAHTLDKAGAHPLVDVLKSDAPVKVKRGGFAQKFGDELVMAFADDDKGGGPGSGVGWGKKEHEAVPIAPVDAAVPLGPVTFTWFPPVSTPSSYQFQLFRTGQSDPVYAAQTAATSVVVDMAAIGAKAGEEYFWTVTVKQTTSEKAFFTLAAADATTAPLKKLQTEEMYQQAGPTEKLLMEAVALADAKLNYHAFQALSRAKAAAADDKLVQGMYDNFVRRVVER